MDFAPKMIAATLDIFNLMVGLEALPETRSTQPAAPACDISSMLGLAGDLRGILTVHWPRPLAAEVTARLLHADTAVSDADIADAMAEIANMIAGGIKTACAVEGRMLELALPTTVAGKDYAVHGGKNSEHIAVSFRVADSQFWTELQLLEAGN